MKRFLKITLILCGSALFLFIINIMLYSFVPQYRDVLGKVVPERGVAAAEGYQQGGVELDEASGSGVVDVKESVIRNDASSGSKDGYAQKGYGKGDEPASEGIYGNDESDLEKDHMKDKESDADSSAYDEKVATTGSVSSCGSAWENGEKQIIDKVYHEDCGTGEGYWVITYADGSVGVE